MSFYRPGGGGTGDITTTPVSIAEGGTGASTVSGARTNLGVTATGQDTTYAFRSNNLSDLSSAATARSNLLPSYTSNTGKVLTVNGSGTDVEWSETVTSVGLATPVGLTSTSGPVTGSGTLTFTYTEGYSLPTTASQSDWDTAYSWGDHALAGYLDSSSIGSSVQAYDSNLTSFVGSFTLPTTDGTNGQVLTTNGSGVLSFSSAGGGSGTVTSVDLSVPTGLSVSGNPITTSGTLAVSFTAGYSIPTTAKQGNWDTAYGWGNHASAGYLTSAAIGSTVQGYDADTAKYDDATANFTGTLQKSGSNVLTASNIGSSVQAYDSNLTSFVNAFTLPTTDGTNGQVLSTNGSGTISWTTVSGGGGSGTVTSVDFSVPTGFAISGNPITTSGTLALSFASGYALPTTAKQTEWDTAYGWGNHASAGYLTSSAIGTTVQAYDADLTTWGGKTAPSGTVVGTTDTQTLSAKTLTDPVIIGAILEDIFTITDGAAFEIDPGNGTIQLITLGASRTPKATNFAAGESVTLMVLDGSAYTLTWTDATFGGSGVVWVGGTAPTLDTTKYTVIELWKVGGQVYGALVGAA